jgi:hypothetical protein
VNSIKCPECGLVNFASAAACKRCQLALEAAPAGFNGPFEAPQFAPHEPAAAGAWGASAYLPPGFDDFNSEAAMRNANLGKASAMMALLAILSMGLTHFVTPLFRPVGPLLLLVGFVTGVVAWFKLRRSGDAHGGLRNARLGTILNGLLLVLVSLAVGAVFVFNYARSAVIAKTFEVRDQPRWREYVSPAGDFSVQMPGEPAGGGALKEALGVGNIPVSGGAALTMDGSGCIAAVADYSGMMEQMSGQSTTADTFLSAAALGILSDKTITVLNRRRITHEGRPGIEIEFFDAPPASGNAAERLRGVARFVWVSPRMYMAVVAAPEGSPLYAQRQTFLDSYRLLNDGK